MIVIFFSLCLASLVFTIVIIISSELQKDRLKIVKRIDSITSGQVSNLTFEQKKKKKQLLNNISWLFEGKALKKLANELSLAAIPLRADEFLLIWFMSALLPAGLIALFHFNLIVMSALILAGSIIPPVILRNAKAKRMALLDKQLRDALAIMGNCLRAGFSFNQAMESISNEMPDPIAKEFTKTLREIKLGLAMEKALANMVERLNNGDLELIVSAVLIQRQVGGNLSEILDSIAGTINERLQIKSEIKVLTATGRTSGMIVGLLPVFLLGILMIINPGYVSMFFNSAIGMAMLILGSVLEITGFIFVKKIVDIKF